METLKKENDYYSEEFRNYGEKLAKVLSEDEAVVVSGISGAYPESENIEHFGENLMNKVDMVNDDTRRWKSFIKAIPQRTGKILHLDKLDSGFFGIHSKFTNRSDPSVRLSLEKSYEALLDAGINPEEIKGSKTGIFVGSCFNEIEKIWLFSDVSEYGYLSSRPHLVTRMAYYYGINTTCNDNVDTACSSSCYALDMAYKSLREGKIDLAIVGTTNLCIEATISLQFANLGVLSFDGKCKVFDDKANGYARSEGSVFIILQRYKDARRIYCKVVHSRINCDGYKEEGITYPSGKLQQFLMEQSYLETKLDPSTVSFVEAHGTGTEVGDPEEANGLEKIFCKERKKALMIGSVKSNIGHGEAAAALGALSKVIIAMETGIIPPNINYETPNNKIVGLKNGTMRVITKPEPLEGDLVSLNSFGFGGANAHLILERNKKIKKQIINSTQLPYLVTLSGRTKEAMMSQFNGISSKPFDPDLIRLFHSIHTYSIPGHFYKGYLLIDGKNKKSHFKKYSGQPKRAVAIFSGLDKGWAKVGKGLLELPLFSKFLEEPAKNLLKLRQFDLLDMLRRGEEESAMHSIVATVAVQIALFNILEKINIKFDQYSGFSYGEIVSAYAEGILTVDEALLIAHSLGEMRVQEPTPELHSILIGNQLEDLEKVVKTKEIQVLWQYNEVVLIKCEKNNHSLLKMLKTKGFFVINNEFIFSSSSIQNKLINTLDSCMRHKSMKHLNLSTKWIKNNFPFTASIEKLSFLEYLVLNFIKIPKFDLLLSKISENETIVEFSRTGVISKLFSNNINQIGCENQNNNLYEFLDVLGALFENGAQPKLDLLYPIVEFPVSRGTPMISPLIKWDFKNKFFSSSIKMTAFEKLDKFSNLVQYYKGHIINGRTLYPASGYIFLIWNYLGYYYKKCDLDFPIILENVRFIRATQISKNQNFFTVINKDSGIFQIMEEGNIVVTGKVYLPKSLENEFQELPINNSSSEICINKEHLYKELKLRGYQYKGLFQGIVDIYPYENRATLEWRNNWPAFIDCMLQSLLVTEKGRSLFVPISIDKIVIDPLRHEKILNKCEKVIDNENETNSYTKVPLQVSEQLKIIQSGGVEIRGFHFSSIQKRKITAEPILEKYCYVPFENVEEVIDWKLALRILIHTLLENQNVYTIKIFELVNEISQSEANDIPMNDEIQEEEESNKIPNILSEDILNILLDLPIYKGNMTVLGVKNINYIKEKLNSSIKLESHRDLSKEDNDIHLIIFNNLISNSVQLEIFKTHLNSDGMILVRVTNEMINKSLSLMENQFNIIAQYLLENERLILFKQKVDINSYQVIKFDSYKYDWINQAKSLLELAKKKKNLSVLFYSENESYSGLLGFHNCIVKEYSTVKIQSFLINDKNAPKFDINDSFYKKQIEKNVAINVLLNGNWGTYRHLPLNPIPLIKSPSAYSEATVLGNFNSLQWVQNDLTPDNFQARSPDEFLVQVHYSSLNFRDVMMVSGKLPSPFIKKGTRNISNHGLEFSGKTLDGRRVFGLVENRGMSTYVVSHKYLTFDLPDNLTLEDAATLPVIYCTCVYGLLLKGKMNEGDTVLIHAGTGGIGQAAINLALKSNCRILATCAPHKKSDLLKLFPELDEKDIGNSRDCSFYDMVMDRTNGRGVDIVLNSLAEEKLIYGLKCLAPGGRFIEIGKYDLSLNVSLNLELIKRGISFHGIMLDTLIARMDESLIDFKNLMDKHINSFKPIERKVFSIEEQTNAFKYMGAGKHQGKVLIQIRPENAPVAPFEITCVPRIILNKQKSYIIIGGLGGVGLELTNWLIIRGAYKIILNSRSGITNGYQASRIKTWKTDFEGTIEISKDDITTEQGVKDLITKANKLGPVGGIFNLAVNLKDNLFEKQTEETFKQSSAPKALATQLLDQTSRQLCPLLDHFVVFSSVSCGRGNISQTNYGLSNSVMERIVEKRQADNLPGLAIQWGAIGDVGLVANMQGNNENFSIGGTLLQSINSCLDCLDKFMNQSEAIVSSMVVAEKLNYDSSNPISFVAQVLCIKNLKDISYHSTLAELGMDSMMAVEIKQGLEREFGIFLSPKELRSLTFASIEQYMAKSKGKQDEKIEENIVSYLDFELTKQLNTPIIKLKSNNSNGKPIFIIPGLDSSMKTFENMAILINAPINFIQLNCAIGNDFNEVSDYLTIIITEELKKQNIQDDEEIHLIGYSLGCTHLYYLVQKLENLGRRCKLVFIEGSPHWQHKVTSQVRNESPDPKLEIHYMETHLLLKMLEEITNLPNDKINELREKLISFNTWDERIDFIMNNINISQLPELPPYLHGIHKRLIMSIENDKNNPIETLSNSMIESPLILIRAVNSITEQIEEDYNLSKICKNLVKVHFSDANHKSILITNEIHNIINDFFQVFC